MLSRIGFGDEESRKVRRDQRISHPLMGSGGEQVGPQVLQAAFHQPSQPEQSLS